MPKPEPKLASDPRSREVRLGVVMFGGISLSVYINGVANELFRASRGRGVYRLLKALTDSEVVVDILSGASAGGINSVLLSAALCNGTEFNDTGKLWREQADINQLLEPVGSEKIDNSVLSGRYHQERMAEAFADLLDVSRTLSPEPEDPSPVNELDLFVTGTDIDGRIAYRLDAMQHRIQLEDHRVLFQLKHRNERKEPFNARALQNGELSKSLPNGVLDCTCDLPKINQTALATLSHITSCFPGAFVPVSVQVRAQNALGPALHPGGDVDGRLSYWGQLASEDKHGKPQPRRVSLMDGGVLKNKPFTSTIQAIFSRLADTQVSRYMLYVDPDPQEAVSARKQHDPSLAGERAHAPHLIPVAFAAASGLPRFESIDADLQSIDTHNAQVRRYEALVAAVTSAVMADPNPSAHGSADPAYELARLGTLAQFVEARFASHLRRNNVLPGAVFEALQGLYGKTGLSHSWDVWFGFRRLIQLTYLTDDSARVTAQSKAAKHVAFSVPARAPLHVPREVITTLNRQIEVYEILTARVEQTITALIAEQPTLNLASEPALRAIEEAIKAMLAGLPRPACFEAPFPLEPLSRCLTPKELSALRSGSLGSAAAGALPFLEAAELFERRLLGPIAPLLEVYQRFGRIDEAALPLALVSELKGRDQIHTVRVSPLDSKRAFAHRFNAAAQRPTSKLCGVQLFDFGAFFKASWRANDLMWGRMDGLSQLLDILLDAKRLQQIEPAVLYDNLTAVLTETWQLDRIFPHSSKEQLDILCSWLKRLAEGSPSALAQLSHDDTLREAWAHAAQLEVLAEELPQVLAHANSESESEELGGVLRQLSGSSRPLVGAAIDAYFRPQNYKIGSENLLADIPTTTLLSYAARAGKHLREALEQSLPTHSIPQQILRQSVDAVLKVSQFGGSLYLRWLAAQARAKKAASA